MAQTTTITVPANTWTQLTNANTTAITFLVNTGGLQKVYVLGVAGAVTPTTDALTNGAMAFAQGEGLQNVNPVDVFPGVTGANRLYAYSGQGAQVAVSHA